MFAANLTSLSACNSACLAMVLSKPIAALQMVLLVKQVVWRKKNYPEPKSTRIYIYIYTYVRMYIHTRTYVDALQMVLPMKQVVWRKENYPEPNYTRTDIYTYVRTYVLISLIL